MFEVICHKYELIFDGRLVLKEWNDLTCGDDEQEPSFPAPHSSSAPIELAPKAMSTYSKNSESTTLKKSRGSLLDHDA
jgi:hypothetical protein